MGAAIFFGKVPDSAPKKPREFFRDQKARQIESARLLPEQSAGLFFQAYGESRNEPKNFPGRKNDENSHPPKGP